MRYGDGGFRWMEMNKKSGGGDVRAGALSWDAVRATHIPRRPKKKPLREKKVGFAEKKLRLTNSGWGQIKFCNSITKVTAIVVALFVSWCEITLPPKTVGKRQSILQKRWSDTYDIANYYYICNVDWQHSAPTLPRGGDSTSHLADSIQSCRGL